MRALFDDIKDIFTSEPRETALRALAKGRGWGFVSRQNFFQDKEWTASFQLFRGKKSKRLVGIITIPTDEPGSFMRVYDYTYYSELGKKVTTVLEYHFPEMQLSAFKILPKGLLQSIKNVFVTEVYSFATSPEFNKRYRLIVTDEEAIKKDLNEDFLDEVGDFAGWTYEGHGNYLLAYRSGEVIPASSLEMEIIRFSQMIDKLVYGLGKVELSNRNRPKEQK